MTPGTLNLPLARLSARRAFAPVVVAIAAAALLLALRGDWGSASAGLAAEAATRSAAGGAADLAAGGPADLADGGAADLAADSATALARASAREGVWSIAILAVVPLLALRAARTVAGWRKGEGDWLGSRRASRGTIFLSTWVGTWIGGAAVLALAGLAIELGVGSGGPTFRRAGEIALPPAAWITPETPSRWTAREGESRWPPGSRARVERGFGAGTNASVEILLRALRGDGAERTASARIAARGVVEVEIPEGNGPLDLEIACARAGARAFVVSDSVEVWEPGARESSASVEILARVALALLAWSALGIGLGAWLSPPTAALALFAAWTPAFLAGDPGWFPAADLWRALEITGSGRVPHSVDPVSIATALALAAIGLAIGAAGSRSWRSAT